MTGIDAAPGRRRESGVRGLREWQPLRCSSRRPRRPSTTVAPYGSAALRVKTRTVSCSAQRTAPATALPADRDREGAGRAGTIHRLAEADREAASRAIAGRCSATGRKRTTDGAVAVRTRHRRLLEREAVRVADAGDDEPVVDVGPERRRRHEREACRALEPGDRARPCPGSAGRAGSRAWTVVEVDRSAEADQEGRVECDARCRAERSGRSWAVVAARVRKTARAGRARGWPELRQGARLDGDRVERRRPPSDRRGETVRIAVRAVPDEVDRLWPARP